MTDPKAEIDGMVTLASVVMTEPPGPTSQFVELEDEHGQGLRLDAGWEERPDGTWALRIPVWLGQYGMSAPPAPSPAEALRRVARRRRSASTSEMRQSPVTPAPPCRQCGPGYRIGDEGCRHTEGGSDA